MPIILDPGNPVCRICGADGAASSPPLLYGRCAGCWNAIREERDSLRRRWEWALANRTRFGELCDKYDDEMLESAIEEAMRK